jgi:CPA1 family monovalent cation:H+ antiporter
MAFGDLLRDVADGTALSIVWIGIVVGLAVIAVRLAWVPIATYLPRALSKEIRRTDPLPEWRPVFLVAWTSMRGIVSLAAALSLPRLLANGQPFPYRSEIILIAMVVIVMTLVVQGLTLEPIIRTFRFAPESGRVEEERMARRESLRRGAEALDDISTEPWVDARDVAWMRNEIRDRLRLHEHHGGNPDGRRRLKLGVLRAERRMLVRLRNEGAISDEVLRDLEQELDLEAMRAGAGDLR